MQQSFYPRCPTQGALIAVTVICALVMVGGCSNVKEKEPFEFGLRNTVMNEGAVALQIAVVQLDTDQRALFADYWNQLDSLALPLPVRRTADRNGLRYAVMAPQCPAALDPLLARRELDLEFLTDLQKQMASQGILESPTRLLTHQRLENDRGEEFEISVSGYLRKAFWKIATGSDRRAVDLGNGEHVKGVMQFTTFPRGDGAVRLVVEPEVHHGFPQQRYGVAERTFLFSESQIEDRLEALKFSIDLQPGESLVIAPLALEDSVAATNVGSPVNIGDLFFGEHATATASINSLPVEENETPSVESNEIESLFAEIDEELNGGHELAAAAVGDVERESPKTSNKPRVKPMFRFMMVRLVHTQMDGLFNVGSDEQQLTTIDQP